MSNTKHVNVVFEVPRDPEQYRATTHFGQRLRERAPDDKRDSVVRNLIERGRVSGASPTRERGANVSQYFKFEQRVHGTDYRMIVGIRREAFVEDGSKHLAVTIMEVHDE